eukprot:TRINITY_DN50558_c0_g1_i1.p1 TRINITY_DN50558_c0_g1~~TRINITY_DN50558_c0_g1_i1.p1  ORF type:complete len:307 (-),score=59.42 TRINITY_DN50558_c0_g1_i1:74-934(-)
MAGSSLWRAAVHRRAAALLLLTIGSDFLALAQPGADQVAAHGGYNVEYRDCARITQRAVVDAQATVQLPVIFMTAAMCNSVPALELWRACQYDELNEHVPAKYQSAILPRVQQAFGRRVAELLRGGAANGVIAAGVWSETELPVPFLVAGQCSTSDELLAWRQHTLQEIERRVPAEFRLFATGGVEGVYRQRLAKLPQQAVLEAPADAGAMDSAASEVSYSERSRLRHEVATREAQVMAAAPVSAAWLRILVLLGLVAPAALAYAGGVRRACMSAPRSQRSPFLDA